MNLYEINKEIEKRMQRLGEMLQDGQTVSDDEAFKILGLIDGDLKDKLGQYRYVILNAKAQEQALSDEIARLNKKKQAVSNNVERLTNLVMLAMQNVGKDEFVYDTGKLRLQNNKPSVRIDIDIERLPAEFIKTEIKPNKTALSKALKAGAVIDGVVLESKQSLRIS